MNWRSSILASVQLVFALSLLPTVLSHDAHVSRLSSGITGVGLFVIAIVYTSMPKMRAAVAMSYCCGILWTLIFLFRPI